MGIKLETELDVRLFNRHTRRIRLTTEGAGFAEQARVALRALDDAVAGVAQGLAEPSGRVRISVGASFGREYVLPVVPRLLATHPKLEIEVSLDNRTVDLVSEGFDIGIRGGRSRDSSLVSHRVCALPLLLLASLDHLSRHGTPRCANTSACTAGMPSRAKSWQGYPLGLVLCATPSRRCTTSRRVS